MAEPNMKGTERAVPPLRNNQIIHTRWFKCFSRAHPERRLIPRLNHIMIITVVDIIYILYYNIFRRNNSHWWILAS